MITYNGKQYKKYAEPAEFSCEGCAFLFQCTRMKNVGLKSKPEYKEVPTGNYGCFAPNIEPFRSCKVEHVIYKEVV